MYVKSGKTLMNLEKYEEFPRFSRLELLILDMLIGKGEMYGLELVENSGGLLKRGSVYVILARLVEKKFLESREEAREYPEIGIPRRKYKVTGLGDRAFRANAKALEFLNTDVVWQV